MGATVQVMLSQKSVAARRGIEGLRQMKIAHCFDTARIEQQHALPAGESYPGGMCEFEDETDVIGGHGNPAM